MFTKDELELIKASISTTLDVMKKDLDDPIFRNEEDQNFLKGSIQRYTEILNKI